MVLCWMPSGLLSSVGVIAKLLVLSPMAKVMLASTVAAAELLLVRLTEASLLVSPVLTTVPVAEPADSD